MFLKLKFKILVVVVFCAVLGCKQTPATVVELKTDIETRPNIILILCDDLGYSDVGFNGSTDIVTPELDKLAKGGTKFSSAYVTHPFCGPSRAGLMTGKYPHTFGSQFNLPMNSGELLNTGIPLDETFISKVLQDAGYYTGIVGKWHLGAVPEFHPLKRGFDDFYGFLGGGHQYFPKKYQPLYDKQVQASATIINDYLKPLEHNNKEVKETEYITDALSREAVRFVNDASKNSAPFFLYLAYNAPHSPLQAKEEDMKLFEKIKDKRRRTYAGMVYAVDRGVGELVESLKATNQYENTLIVFLSDNGGSLRQAASNNPLKGEKGDTSEGGYRVPMFFHYPKVVPSGKVFDHPVSAIDFYPTFAHLGEAKIPKGKQLHGKDIWNHFLAGTNAHKEDMIYALRHRSGYSDVGARVDDWKVLKTGQDKWKLFNIKNDIREEHDLSSQHPERLNEMVSRVKKWSKEHTQPRWFDPANLKEVWKEKEMSKFKETFQIEN